jgi:hypothetical protein
MKAGQNRQQRTRECVTNIYINGAKSALVVVQVLHIAGRDVKLEVGAIIVVIVVEWQLKEHKTTDRHKETIWHEIVFENMDENMHTWSGSSTLQQHAVS